jgi:hypothetical protein
MTTTLDKKTEQIWQKARLIKNDTFKNPEVQNSSDEFRLDDFGAIMKLSDYGKQTEYGWTLDHILPDSKGGTDHSTNLQALHWKNNLSKADSFFGIDVAIGTTAGSPFYNVLSGAPLRQYLTLTALEELAEIYPNNPFVTEAIQRHLTYPQEFIPSLMA